MEITEADHDEALLIAHLCKRQPVFQNAEAGYGTITRINIRIKMLYFDSGNIAHICPSGNAPQLRFCAVANSHNEPDRHTRDALAEPSGLASGAWNWNPERSHLRWRLKPWLLALIQKSHPGPWRNIHGRDRCDHSPLPLTTHGH